MFTQKLFSVTQKIEKRPGSFCLTFLTIPTAIKIGKTIQNDSGTCGGTLLAVTAEELGLRVRPRRVLRSLASAERNSRTCRLPARAGRAAFLPGPGGAEGPRSCILSPAVPEGLHYCSGP